MKIFSHTFPVAQEPVPLCESCKELLFRGFVISSTDVKRGQIENEPTDSFYLCSFPTCSCCFLPAYLTTYIFNTSITEELKIGGETFLKQTVLSPAVLHGAENHVLKALPAHCSQKLFRHPEHLLQLH